MYDPEFYRKYAAYVEEPTVRQAHDQMLQMLASGPEFDKVIDLGCGQSMEFDQCWCPQVYLGIDANAIPEFTSDERIRNVITADYLKDHDLTKIITKTGYHYTAFVSLFSSECIQPYLNAYLFYMRLFQTYPHITKGLVSGFYYADQKDRNPITEAGGISSYQTLESIEDIPTSLMTNFRETRVMTRVPSQLFGPNVVEVWKLFERTS
jgi:hypothetical protein